MDIIKPIPSDISISTQSVNNGFVHQTYPDDVKLEERPSYSIKSSLSVSKIYEEEFLNHHHLNYYGEIDNGYPFIASVRVKAPYSTTINNNDKKYLLHAIIRTHQNNYYVTETTDAKNEYRLLQLIFEKAQLYGLSNIDLVHDITANEKILEYDKYFDEHLRYKVGVLSQRANQTSELEILSNHQRSPEMLAFLRLISTCVSLHDFEYYRGDLDTKTNLHGSESFFTLCENHQIMFNVGPMIPCAINDKEYIMRKSLVCNSLVCIIFQEDENVSFQPDMILGKVVQVFIVIKPIQNNSQLYYKIETWRRSDIEPLIDPPGGIHKACQPFKYYFLKLILNTFNSIYKTDFFQKRVIEPRCCLRTDHLRNLCQIFSSYTTYDASAFTDGSDDDLLDDVSNVPAIKKPNSLFKKGIAKKLFRIISNSHGLSKTVSYTPGSESVLIPDGDITSIKAKQSPLLPLPDNRKPLISPMLRIKLEAPTLLPNQTLRQSQDDLKSKEQPTETTEQSNTPRKDSAASLYEESQSSPPLKENSDIDDTSNHSNLQTDPDLDANQNIENIDKK